MSGRNIFKSSMIVGAGVVALTLGACASSGSAGSRYGDIYAYESGGSGCVAGACGAVVAPHVDTIYDATHTGTIIGGQAVSPGVVYTDCSQTSNLGCVTPAPIHSQPVQTHIPQLHTPTTIHAGPINCPTGTTPAGDGTCMITGSGTSYTGVTHSGVTHSNITHGSTHTTTTSGALHCPSGTTPSHDGTCMVSTPTIVHPPAPINTGYHPVEHHTAPVYLPIRK